MSIKIKKAETKKDLMRFIKFPYKLYKNDPDFATHLIVEFKDMFDPKKNPFFRYADIEFYLAERDGKIVGRVCSIINHNHNEFHNEKTGFFGFFECVNDYDVAAALLDKTAESARSKGMDTLRGPMNFSTNDECAFLTDGFDSPPVVMMPYNPRYYINFMDRYGMKKAKDLVAYKIIIDEKLNDRIPDRLKRIVAKAKRLGYTVRSLNLKDFAGEMRRAHEVYNDAWEKNWGFVPMKADEFEHLGKDLKQIVVPDLMKFVEYKGSPVAFMLILPDINEIMKKIRNGKLLPFGILKLLLGFKKIKGLRLPAAGIKKAHRMRGIDSLLYYEGMMTARKLGYTHIEISWLLEDNKLIRRATEFMTGKLYKTYRVYEKGINI